MATSDNHPTRVYRWVGERGLRVETGETTLARYRLLMAHAFAEIEDIIPADQTLLVVLHPGTAPSPALHSALGVPLTTAQRAEGALHRIPVEYGGDAGPDLGAMAALAGMDVDAYIRCHAAAEYNVAFLGFQPGFPYLGGLPGALCAARRATPRTRIEAGSVGIGGCYTGIYPRPGPGGWHIIGRTDVVLFDAVRASPSLLLPGDRIRFVPQ